MMWSSPVLAIHTTAGMMGMVSGAGAMILRKGAPRHALAGKVFVASMLTMAAAAVYLAELKHQDSNIGGGILTLYLVATAWLTAKRRDGQTSKLDWVVMLVPLALGILTCLGGVKMVQGGMKEGAFRVGMSFFMGSMLLLAGVGDLRMLLRGGVFWRQRVVRHLWRMCLGFFIATGSFFLGQRSKMFPSVFHDSPLLLIPAFFAVDVVDFLVGAGPFYDRVEKDVCTARRSFVRYDDGSWLMR